MNKKLKIFTIVCAFALIISAVTFTVLSLKNLNLNISGDFEYTAPPSAPLESEYPDLVFNKDSASRTATVEAKVHGSVEEEPPTVNNTLTSVDIPSQIIGTDGVVYTVTKIEDSGFAFCNALKTVTIPSSIESIGNYAFMYSNLSNVNCSEGLKSIGENAFSYSGWFIDETTSPVKSETPLTINLPNSLTNIGSMAFYWANIISLKVPSNVTTIGTGALLANGLDEIIIDCAYLASLDDFFNESNPVLNPEQTPVVYVNENLVVGNGITSSFNEVSTDKTGYKKYTKI